MKATDKDRERARDILDDWRNPPARLIEMIAEALAEERERAGEIALRELFGEYDWPDAVKRVAERMRAAILRGDE